MERPERLASLHDTRLIYKCEKVAHIKVEDDLRHHAELLAGGDPDPALHHDGHRVHAINVHAGSAPVNVGRCNKCGGKMIHVTGEFPTYVFLPTDPKRPHLVIHSELEKAQAQRAR